jgi:hypothetical protein
MRKLPSGSTSMVQAVPLEEHLARLEVELLGYAVPHRGVARAADGGEVGPGFGVGREERGVPRGDGELVQVAFETVSRLDPAHLAVGGVEDHVLTYAVPGHDATLPPGEHGLAPVGLDLEVRRVPVL